MSQTDNNINLSKQERFLSLTCCLGMQSYLSVFKKRDLFWLLFVLESVCLDRVLKETRGHNYFTVRTHHRLLRQRGVLF